MMKKSEVQNPEVRKRAVSEKRLIKLEKIGFELEAERLRKQYSNKHLLKQMKMHHRHSKGKKLLTEIPQSKVGNFLEPTKIISLTAHKWVIHDYFSGKYIRGYRARDSHSLSVFSKLLVFCAVNTLVEKHKLDMSRFETIVTEGVLKIHGNSKILKHDDIVSLEDILYLMIMEESEIYETILAVNVGAYLEKKRKKQYYSVFDANDKYMKEHLKQFYDLVNSYCKLLKLDNIRYVESQPEAKKHKNKCSASDVAVLSIQCLKIPLFMEILKKLDHTVTIKYIDSQGKLTHRNVTISNKAVLNKFIPYFSVCRNWDEQSFMDSHCSIFYENQNEDIRPIVVILLGCYGPKDREKDIQQVAQWYIKNKKSLANYESLKKEEKQSKPSIGVLQSTIKKPSIDIQAKIEKKLKVSVTESRYDEAIKFRAKNIRTKTQI